MSANKQSKFQKFGTQALITGLTILFLFGAWKALKWKWGQQKPDPVQVEASKPQPAPAPIATQPSALVPSTPPPKAAPAELPRVHPKDRKVAPAGKFSDWEDIWGKTMMIYHDGDGIEYEYRDHKGQITVVTCEVIGNEAVYTITPPKGKPREVRMPMDKRRHLELTGNEVEERFKHKTEDISYAVVKNTAP